MTAPEITTGIASTALGTGAAKQLATTTKSVPQMQGSTPRWLLSQLAWTEVDAGTYRVNRRLTHVVGDGRVEFVQTGTDVAVIPAELGELAPLRGFTDEGVLTELAGRFRQRTAEPGEELASFGHPVDEVVLIATGKVQRLGTGPYGEASVLGTWADGDHFGAEALTGEQALAECTARTATRCVLLTLSREAFLDLRDRSPALAAHLDAGGASEPVAANRYGEAPVELAAGHVGEAVLPRTFVDYDAAPREYPMQTAQTTLRVHTRVADLYSTPMDQTQQQLRLTVEELRERQERELLTHPDVGLLHNVAFDQRIQTRSGPPGPADMDELLSRRRRTDFFLAHPRAVAAFRRACTASGIHPTTVSVGGHAHTAWRGVPVLPSIHVPVTPEGTTSILAMRTGEDDAGVIGLRPAEVPDEHDRGLSVRFTGIDDLAVMSYLVTAYHSVAVLVPDALGVLENVEIAR